MESEAARIMQPDYPNTPDEFTDKWGYAKATGDVGLKIFEKDLQRILEAAIQAERDKVPVTAIEVLMDWADDPDHGTSGIPFAAIKPWLQAIRRSHD